MHLQQISDTVTLSEDHVNCRVRLLQALEALVIPIAAISVALALFGVFIALAGKNPLDVFYSISRGEFGSWFSWQNTLVRATPLLLTALCTALPARIGLIVIGGEGTVIAGGLVAALTGITLNGLPPPIVIIVMMLMEMLVGGFWIGTVGSLKHYRGVNETISSWPRIDGGGVGDFRAVESSLLSLCFRGYEYLFLEDCCGATCFGNHEAAIKMVKKQRGVFGSASCSQNVLATLS